MPEDEWISPPSSVITIEPASEGAIIDEYD